MKENLFKFSNQIITRLIKQNLLCTSVCASFSESVYGLKTQFKPI